MGTEDKTAPASGRLADALYMLGLLTADKDKFEKFINSQEFKAFEERLKDGCLE